MPERLKSAVYCRKPPLSHTWKIEILWVQTPLSGFLKNPSIRNKTPRASKKIKSMNL